MILNPARLESAKIVCSKCHKKIIERVDNSLMNSMSGVLDVLRYQFKESKSIIKTSGINYLKNLPSSKMSLAENHFSKLCGACHINQDQKIFKNYTPRGGGCVDCHKVGEKKIIYNRNGNIEIIHPKLTTKIPSKNCLKCHNRSNRIGLAYFGKFESEGYGTPYKNGKLTHQIDKGRYYYELPADIHHKKSKLDCIDCHNDIEVMGDGKAHKHMEEAIYTKCEDCHNPTFKKATPKATLLAFLNGEIPTPKEIAFTKKGDIPIYNLQKRDNKILFYRKRDGKSFNLTKMSKKPYHTQKFHKRLDCSACHTHQIASCYGCHELYSKELKQYDWIKRKKTAGRWRELRSFLRYESPALAIAYNKKIMPTAPGCQVITTIYDKNSTTSPFHSFAFASWSPHSIQKSSRSCIDCHFNPKTLSLGAGILDFKEGNITFTPFYNSKSSGLPISYPIDALISINGKQNQTFSRENARGFNKKELYKIVNAYKCILCHDKWSDKIYQDFQKSQKAFFKNKTKCFK